MNVLKLVSIAFVAAAPTVYTNGAFFGDPPNENYPWAVHDQHRPQPPRVEPGSQMGDAPSDALILFDGTKESFLNNWIHSKPVDKRDGEWQVIDGVMQCTPGAGYIETDALFGDCQLHIEWAAPTTIDGDGQNRGNSGVFFMNQMVEVQVLDNFENPTYADGTAGAVYGVMPPAANALRAPGEWQSYDIIFRRPIVKDGVVLDPGALTVLCNGVVLQDNTALDGGGGFCQRQPLNRVFPELGRLSLQDHGNPVRYRNIWIRPLRPRALDGGYDGRLSTETTMTKRAETAAKIRQGAESEVGLAKLMRLLESLVYEVDKEACEEVDALIANYLKQFDGMPEAQANQSKGAVMHLDNAVKFLIKHERLPKDYFAQASLKEIIDRYDWAKRRN